MRRFSAIFLAGLACLAAAPAGAWAAADDLNAEGGAKHVVIVSTTADGSQQSRAGVQVASAAGPNVSSENLAEARATNCTGCRGAAVAIQAVFVTGDPNFESPKNAAVAVNAGCTGCVSFAYAFQYVLPTHGPVHLSAAGQQDLLSLRREFATVTESRLPGIRTKEDADNLLAELKGIAEQKFKKVIDDEHVSAGAGVVHEQVRMALGPSSSGTTSTPLPSDTTTTDQTPTTDQPSTTGSDQTSGTGTAGTDQTSGTDTSGTSGTDQTSSSGSTGSDQQSSTATP